jgi:CHAD domain-containing protein/uncharacterized protein YjbK
VETEAKYIVPDGAAFARLQETDRLGPYRRDELVVKQAHDRYLDTPDRRFYHEQWALRLREVDGGLLLTLKGLGGAPNGATHARDELEIPVQSLDAATWPRGEARELAMAIMGDQPLVDLVSLDQMRYVACLRKGKRQVAEWSLDDVTFPGPEGPLQAYELEIELGADGRPGDLAKLEQRLVREFRLTPQKLSKLERALRLRAGAVDAPAPAPPKPPRPMRPSDPMSTATRQIVAAQRDALLAAEPGARDKETRAIHKMRVATRRLRSALSIGAPYLDAGDTRRLRAGLRELGRALGEARDLDVLIAQAEAFQAALPEEARAGFAPLLQDWSRRRSRARKRLRRVLESREYRRLLRDLDDFSAERERRPDHGAVVKARQVRHVLAAAVWERYGAVRAYETIMDAPSIEQLHALRKVGKDLRYTLEFFRGVLPEETDALVAELVQAQDQLGALHDAELAVGLIGELHADQPAGDDAAPEPASPIGAYLADRRGRAEQVGAEFAGHWATIVSPEWRARLATVAAAV